MSNVPAVLKPPHHEYSGNLVWNIVDVAGREPEISASLDTFRELGYWASAFPEGDGVTFIDKTGDKRNEDIASEARKCFGWLHISLDLTHLNQEAPKRSPMASFGYEDTIRIQKSLIALTQLEDAIGLFLEGKRLSSITLAAAADGVFAGLLKQKGIKSAAEETWHEIERLRKDTSIEFAGDREKRDAFNEWNWHQNRLKHHDSKDEELLEINVFDQAYYAIQRAVTDAEKLGLKVAGRIRYEKWIFENV